MPDAREVIAAQLAAHHRARAALDRARAQGVQCTSCGGNATLPEDLTTPQFPSRFCGTLLVTSQYVPPEMLAGLGLRARLDALRVEAAAESKRRDKYILVGPGIPAVVLLTAVFVPLLLARSR